MNIPSKDDWGEIDQNDLDAQWAFKQFFGKSLEEADRMSEENALNYQEDLESMPTTAFNFYAPPLANYLISERAAGDADGASSFLRMVIWMFKERSEVIYDEIRELLLRASEHVANRQAFYEADSSIYGEFPELYEEIIASNKNVPNNRLKGDA